MNTKNKGFVKLDHDLVRGPEWRGLSGDAAKVLIDILDQYNGRNNGSIHYGVADHEKPSVVVRRSLFVVKDVAAGEELTRENVRVIRPGHGLAPKHLGDVLGRKASRGLSRGSPLSWSDLEGAD